MDVRAGRRVEVLYFEGCPNRDATVQRVREVMGALGVPGHVEEVEVSDLARAQALGFLGSPTVRVDGVDVEAGAGPHAAHGLACRTYDGSGIPPREMLARALAPAQPSRGGAPLVAGDRCRPPSARWRSCCRLEPVRRAFRRMPPC